MQDDTLWLERVEDKDSEIRIEASGRLKVLLLAGQPLREPVEAYGPFVMNTREQLAEAFADYRSGSFGEIA